MLQNKNTSLEVAQISCPVFKIVQWVSLRKSCSKKDFGLAFPTPVLPWHPHPMKYLWTSQRTHFGKHLASPAITYGPNLAHCLFGTAHELKMVFTFLHGFFFFKKSKEDYSVTCENDVKSYFSIHKVLLGCNHVLIYMLSVVVFAMHYCSRIE